MKPEWYIVSVLVLIFVYAWIAEQLFELDKQHITGVDYKVINNG